MTDRGQAAARSFPGSVAKIIDRVNVVVNRGKLDGVKAGQRFIVYRLSDDSIVDPDTGDDLGRLEIVLGSGKATHVQESICTVTSDRTEPGEKTIVRRRNLAQYASLFGGGYDETETFTPSSTLVPFKEVVVGDKARPV